MSTTQQILSQEFEKLRVDIIREYDRLGMRASGKTAESLDVITSVNNGKLIGDKTFGALESGRSPSSSGSKPGNLIDEIKQWIKDKGIVSDIKNDTDNSSLAFLITRKIHKQGWMRNSPRNPIKGVELISNVVTQRRIQSIIDKVGVELTLTLVTKLENEFKKIKV